MKFLESAGLAALLLASTTVAKFIAFADEDAVNSLKLPIFDPARSAPITTHSVSHAKVISTTTSVAMATVSSASLLPFSKREMERLCCDMFGPGGLCKRFAPCSSLDSVVPTIISSRAEKLVAAPNGACCFARGLCVPCPSNSSDISTRGPGPTQPSIVRSSSARLHAPRIFVFLGMVQKAFAHHQQCTDCRDPACHCPKLEPPSNTTQVPVTAHHSSSARLQAPRIFTLLGMVQKSFAQTSQECTDCRDPTCHCPKLEPPSNTTSYVPYTVNSDSVRLRAPYVFVFLDTTRTSLSQMFLSKRGTD